MISLIPPKKLISLEVNFQDGSDHILVKVLQDSDLVTNLDIPKVFGDSISAHLQSFLSELQCMLGDLITGYIVSQNEDGILAVSGLPLAICQVAFILNNCSMMVSTSGCTLSTSSKSTTAFEHCLTFLVSCPPSSWPT